MRELKYHEKKLLKKVDFFSWKAEAGHREATVVRRYLLQNREDYIKYNKIVGKVTKLCSKLKQLDQTNERRSKVSELLLSKLYNLGIISNTASLVQIENLTVSSFCRRRLPVVMVRLKMSENLKEATTLIEQGN
jgi:U3 small nucleolar ribonucleoprotein protein IMP3